MDRQPGLESGSGLLGRATVVGFATAVAVWMTWFVTHLPWVDCPESISIPIILVVWLIAIAAAIIWTGNQHGLKSGPLGGVICSLASLLVLPSRLLPATGADNTVQANQGNIPPLLVAALGFLAVGAVIGLTGAALAKAFPPRAKQTRSLAQMGVVVALGIVPLLAVGGLVTSTNSGMAVPDWPNTYGSNMFLYPLGPRSAPGLFLEHAHRLFGSLVGLMSLVLAIWATVAEGRRWVKAFGWVLFGLILGQGILGGARVLMGSEQAAADKPIWAVLHGVLAQVVFGVAVAFAATLTPLFMTSPRLTMHPQIRRFKVFSTGFTHALLLQLLLGAVYRHMRGGHALWSHAGFSVIVVIIAALAGFTALSLSRRDQSPGAAASLEAAPGLSQLVQRIGLGIVAVVGLQFALGWVTFFAAGQERSAASPLEAIIRTAHHTNGALLIALAALSFVWSRWLLRRAVL